MRLEWVKSPSRYCAENYKLNLGKFTVAQVAFDGSVSKSDKKCYKTSCTLPGVKSYFGHFESADDAKKKVENVVNYWVSEAIGE